MESSPFVGFGWGQNLPNQMPSPIPHDDMHDTSPVELASMQNVQSLDYPHDDQAQVLTRSATPGPSGLRATSGISNYDTAMDDVEDNADLIAVEIRGQKRSRRPVRSEPDWDAKKHVLYGLYIKDQRMLTETMDIMRRTYKFEAT